MKKIKSMCQDTLADGLRELLDKMVRFDFNRNSFIENL